MAKPSSKIHSTSNDSTDDNTTDNGADRAERGIGNARKNGEVIMVETLNTYRGETLEEKVDTFITAHPVVMVNRSWCIFSIDAIDFLVRMGVSVNSLEVDIVPEGPKVLKYLKQKLSHNTTPLIFIQGEFLGGFEDVSAMYNTGSLQENYISKISNTESCEKLAAISPTKPLMWFPEKVNAKAIRSTGVLTFFVSAICAVASLVTSWGPYIAYGLVLDFVLRLIGGGRIAPLGILAALPCRCMEPIPRAGRPKQFASMCGLLFSALGALFYSLPIPYHDYLGSVFIGILAVCCGMEGFLDFCLGCVFFRIGIQLKIISK